MQITHRMICISQVEVATEHGLYKSACMHVNCVAALVFYRPYHMEVSDIYGAEFRHINKVSRWLTKKDINDLIIIHN